MIEEISIRDLGVITDARLQLGPGFNVLTGETGAGKTMVLSALGLLLGERADAATVRKGAAAAFVEGRWQLTNQSAVTQLVEDAGGVIEAGELLLNRTLSSEGRSRASVGGSGAPVALLSQVGEHLVVVHGQADQIRLKSATAQREALDRFAGIELAQVLAKYREQFEAWRSAAKALKQLQSDQGSRAAELEQLKVAVQDLEQVAVQSGEDVELASLATRLTHAEEIRLAVQAAHEALSSEGFDVVDATGAVAQSRRSLEAVAQHDDALEALATRARELGFAVNDLAADLNGYLASLEGNTASELERVQSRRAELSRVMRLYGPTLDDVLSYYEAASKRLLELDSPDNSEESLTLAVNSALQQVHALGDQLTKLRTEAAERLAAEVTEELRGLAMAGASLVVEVSDASEYSAAGKDQVSIQLAAYPGADPRPIGKGASGGELSRIMLAIEVVLAKGHEVATFIFDEVDAGVGGSAAIEVGKRLAKLAQNAQVIVVTHLAQVAAFADQHLRVTKSSTEGFTSSDVTVLEPQDRLSELTRMLSGLADSESGQAHAAELIELAKTQKA